MKVITSNPMTIEQLIAFTGKDALLKSERFGKIRILSAAGNQEIVVDSIAVINGKKFGLRKRKSNNNKSFDYTGVLIK